MEPTGEVAKLEPPRLPSPTLDVFATPHGTRCKAVERFWEPRRRSELTGALLGHAEQLANLGLAHEHFPHGVQPRS